MRSAIRLFDRLLRRTQGIFEYWDDPNCLFRVGITRAPHAISLPDAEIPAGAKVLSLHFWNEHMPRIPPEGPNVILAMRGVRMLRASFRMLAHETQRDPRMEGALAVGGPGALIYPDAGPGAEKLLRRLGFTIFPCQHPLGRFGEFWENLYTWGLIWTFNEVTLQQRRLLRLQRTELWMSINELVRIHARTQPPAETSAPPQPAAPPKQAAGASEHLPSLRD